ncbi:hypothetical protein EHQ58_12410 [Leptospira ognonensis]|uniref:Uncharacterized protein n=1 Tax=Leptospira ognonensis TaxID=2484945 RepID=A0A4R9K1W9_9LEPT|nr:hypothetical protein [Leptospira ognonensis]TGL58176.1 hypothetical protein EHQ58_12410 [Leptospira ognonensis]
MHHTDKSLLATFLRGLIAGIGFTFGILSMGLFAISLTGTFNTFFSGQVVKASDINTNFSTLRTAVESIPDWTKSGVNAVFSSGAVFINTSSQANAATLTVNGRISSSAVGVYCGTTSATYTGNIGGYSTAKSLCEASSACNNVNAHMCTAHELAISRQLGITIASNTWFTSHGYWVGAVPAVFVSDCEGWTSDSSSIGGSFNNPSSTYGSWNYCNNNFKISCCL